MSKFKAFTSLLLTAVMSVTLLSACASNNGNEPAKSNESSNTSTNVTETNAVKTNEEPITLTYFLNAPGDNVPEHFKIADLITEKTGVTVKYERLVGEIEQKLGVMIAGGEYPDMIYPGDKAHMLIDAGALLPLEDLIEEHAPNLKKLYANYWERMKATDGHIYSLPNSVPTGQPNRAISPAFWIQKEVLKDAGYPKITTFDQYVDVLKNYVQKYPQIDGQDTIPFEILTYDWRLFTLTTAMQFLAGGPNDSRAMVNPETGELTFYQTDEKISKRYYEKLNEMWNEGLIDKEAFVMNYDQYLAKLSSGRVLGMHDQTWQFQDATAALKQQDKLDRMFAPLQLTFDESIKADYMDVPSINYGNGWSMSVDNKDPVRTIKFIDTLASDEMQILRSWGVKDEDYKVDENGRFIRTPEQRKWFESNENALGWDGKIMWFFPNASGTLPDGNNYWPGEQPEEIVANYTETDKKILEAYGVKTYPELFNPGNTKRKYFPIWSIELTEDLKIFDQKLNDLNKKYPPQMVVAKSKEQFNEYWDEYVTSVNKLDVKGWMDYHSAEVKKRQENW
ncbi:extracellular solute-binding protein [Paenibacillus anaericanus]|uniref:Extracellular solute-binding protein n=1 Tax=Paenibacillus anaericanus TaxID=170367 RepID=A0A433XZ59_9BACL|nr:extracellular solute-binding protein [Paenibacillus anaericanus]RUT40479.1 extracellular solute-binding protein [Paenibacillus anaericanus]